MDTPLPSAEKLTPLQLNNIKLDVRHTILTPDYLENLAKDTANQDMTAQTKD